MASCDAHGKVRAANKAFLEFLGCAGDAGGLELRDSALPEVYPGLFADLDEVIAKRRPIKRVIYLNVGLSVILAFIGVKLIIEALHGSHIDDIGAIHLPHIGIATSLGFIAGTLLVTTVASLIKSGYDRRRVSVD